MFHDPKRVEKHWKPKLNDDHYPTLSTRAAATALHAFKNITIADMTFRWRILN